MRKANPKEYGNNTIRIKSLIDWKTIILENYFAEILVKLGRSRTKMLELIECLQYHIKSFENYLQLTSILSSKAQIFKYDIL
jgi:hypothetical protein